MIVERGRVSGLRPGEASATIPGYELAWRGVAYYPGERPGPAAVAAALSEAGPDPMVDAARRLRGNFFLSIRDVANGRTVAPVDRFETAGVVGKGRGVVAVDLAETIDGPDCDISRGGYGRRPMSANLEAGGLSASVQSL